MRRIASIHASNCLNPCIELPQSMGQFFSIHASISQAISAYVGAGRVPARIVPKSQNLKAHGVGDR